MKRRLETGSTGRSATGLRLLAIAVLFAAAWFASRIVRRVREDARAERSLELAAERMCEHPDLVKEMGRYLQ